MLYLLLLIIFIVFFSILKLQMLFVFKNSKAAYIYFTPLLFRGFKTVFSCGCVPGCRFY